MSKRITKIPIIGNSGKMLTGAMQFQDDWPGLWIRGETAIPLMCCIRNLQERLADSTDVVVISALSKLQAVADVIERDVMIQEQ